MGEPAYRLIADRIRERIRDGTYPPGTRLPSVMKLAEEHGVSDVVTRRVYHELVKEGWVESRPASGYFARRPDPLLNAIDSITDPAARARAALMILDQLGDLIPAERANELRAWARAQLQDPDTGT